MYIVGTPQQDRGLETGEDADMLMPTLLPRGGACVRMSMHASTARLQPQLTCAEAPPLCPSSLLPTFRSSCPGSTCAARSLETFRVLRAYPALHDERPDEPRGRMRGHPLTRPLATPLFPVASRHES